ncbi:hypothetical protein CPC08DRAFT_715946 [Agrocybe pediades]|nr:hypothetical protein CPC08DRAFT_715946 [Agrocybe pediades]
MDYYSKSSSAHPPSPPPVYVREVAGLYSQPYSNPSPIYAAAASTSQAYYAGAGPSVRHSSQYAAVRNSNSSPPGTYIQQGFRHSNSYPGSMSPPPTISRPMPMRPNTVSTVYDRAENVGDRFASELYGRCARGEHQPTRKYGLVGIVAAIVFFPVGLLCLCVDREKSCKRCGRRL